MTKAAKANSTPDPIFAAVPKKNLAGADDLNIPGVRFVLPWGILNVDASVIDEQENHVVLTLRIPKEFVRKYQPLLSALVEMSAPTLSPTEPEGDLADA